jgi:hypothetical protein
MYIRIQQFTLAMKMAFHEIALIDDTVLHLESTSSVEPPFFVLSFVAIAQPVGSYRHQLYIIIL